MEGKKLPIIIAYRIKSCFTFRLYTRMEHLDDMSKLSLALPHGLYAVACGCSLLLADSRHWQTNLGEAIVPCWASASRYQSLVVTDIAT